MAGEVSALLPIISGQGFPPLWKRWHEVVPDIGFELFLLGDIIAFLIRYEMDGIERFHLLKSSVPMQA